MRLTNSTVFGLVFLDNPKTENFKNFWLSASMEAEWPQKGQESRKDARKWPADRTIAAVAIARQPNQLEFCFQPKELG
ncbi:MAG: hypothetical protein E5Y61_26230 [Mesorhizobium sp.]|uniref:hypothetical protein n=1 Tax=Mesorhizobium sp. TaxID=1871066 RepID=UPI000FE56152|nr:hypothetical protein [Mesorhizobium sp.]RWO30520.1 MAG: hypothetical protein EOS10_18655 [Mesorhizobium sp.]TIM25108.1 MAG: hypothetical protein E5Y61_26230 [Mesorhizobium sp.]